jgi:hypothetical protein
MDIRLSATPLKNGSMSCTKIRESTNANIATSSDSLKNWAINWLRSEPIALRMPTSLARLSERAVVKFMKLMQASSNTKAPITPYNHTNWSASADVDAVLEFRVQCQSDIGKRNRSRLTLSWPSSTCWPAPA